MLERIRNGRTDLVRDFVTAGNAPAFRDEAGVSLLQWCAYFGDVTAMRWLIEAGETLETLGENLGLGDACFHGHWRLCQFLIESGAEPNHQDGPARETPLHVALSRANPLTQDRVATVLLAAGADPNIPCATGSETGSFMRDVRTRGETPLHRAAAFGSEATVRALIDCGGDRQARDSAGDSPLSWASWHLRPPAILRLLCYGEFRIHPAADWRGDHGCGATGMDENVLGTPSTE